MLPDCSMSDQKLGLPFSASEIVLKMFNRSLRTSGSRRTCKQTFIPTNSINRLPFQRENMRPRHHIWNSRNGTPRRRKSTTRTKLQLLIAGQCHLPGHFDENVLFLCKWKINNNNSSGNNRLDTNINVLFLGILQAFYLLPVKISTSSRYCLPPLEKCNVLNVKSKQVFVKEF